MAIQNFIPTIWSARLFSELDKSHVLVARCNRDYEGEISAHGDTVKINAIGDIDVNNYVKNSTTISPQELSDAQTILEIDQAKYFAFKVDDVDQVQSKPKVMQEAMRKAAYALRDNSDDYVAKQHGSAGKKITATAQTSAKVIETMSLISNALHEKNVPQEGRWLVAPPWFISKLVLAKILQTDGSVGADTEFNNGWVGRCFGFDIYMTNNLVETAATPVHQMLAGTNRAMTFAQQILKMEAYRPEGSFSDAVKGLYVYGHKVVDPNALVRITATYQAEA